MRPRRLAYALVAVLTVAQPGLAQAAVPEDAWSAMKEREVVIRKLDGSEVRGTLVGVAAETVTVMRDSDGRVVVVNKADVEELLGKPVAPPPSAPPPATAHLADAPPASAGAPPSAVPVTAASASAPRAAPMGTASGTAASGDGTVTGAPATAGPPAVDAAGTKRERISAAIWLGSSGAVFLTIGGIMQLLWWTGAMHINSRGDFGWYVGTWVGIAYGSLALPGGILLHVFGKRRAAKVTAGALGGFTSKPGALVLRPGLGPAGVGGSLALAW